MAQTLTIISNIAFVLAAISFAFAAVCWFRFNILEVYGDLSGRTARKSIEQIRESNEKGSKKTYQSSPVNKSRGKLTSAMSGALKKEPTKNKKTQQEPEKPKNSKLHFAETGLLSENKAYEDLAPETEALAKENEGTVLLQDTEQPGAVCETTALDEMPPMEPLEMLDEIISIHTEESI